jgi:hypothetical protein
MENKMYVLWTKLLHTDDGQTDRQSDMTKLAVAFRNFARAPKNKNSKWTE